MKFTDLPLSQCAACADGERIQDHLTCRDTTRRVLDSRWLIRQPHDMESWRALDYEGKFPLGVDAPTFQRLLTKIRELS
ncbi:hypothetical protein GCM10028801_31200 [Nocardioides maradonensis]